MSSLYGKDLVSLWPSSASSQEFKIMDSGGNFMDALNEKQAEFVYDAARLAAQAAGAPVIPVMWVWREDSFKEQFRDVIDRQCGENRSSSPEELHGSWMQAYFEMGWVYGEEYSREKKVHPDLVPYEQLGQLERDKDAVFVMLCEIARQYIYELVPNG